jgi:predicted RNA-binding Zn-ribbon protein involved in translation (DUF1610 family)
MKKVFSSSYIADCDQLRMVLSLAGIESMMKNEFGNPIGLVITGGVASFAEPELWVEENDYEAAMQIVVSAMKAQKADAASSSEATAVDFSEWQCPKCGEVIEGTMNACWKCDTERTQQT